MTEGFSYQLSDNLSLAEIAMIQTKPHAIFPGCKVVTKITLEMVSDKIILKCRQYKFLLSQTQDFSLSSVIKNGQTKCSNISP